jgi:hypothetical protein
VRTLCVRAVGEEGAPCNTRARLRGNGVVRGFFFFFSSERQRSAREGACFLFPHPRGCRGPLPPADTQIPAQCAQHDHPPLPKRTGEDTCRGPGLTGRGENETCARGHCARGNTIKKYRNAPVPGPSPQGRRRTAGGRVGGLGPAASEDDAAAARTMRGWARARGIEFVSLCFLSLLWSAFLSVFRSVFLSLSTTHSKKRVGWRLCAGSPRKMSSELSLSLSLNLSLSLSKNQILKRAAMGAGG